MNVQTTLGALSGEPGRDVKMLYSFVLEQNEELRAVLSNLGVTNWNDLELGRYEQGWLQIYTEQLELRAQGLEAEFIAADSAVESSIKATTDQIQLEVNENKGTIQELSASVSLQSGRIDTVVKDLNQLDGTVGTFESRISQNASSITAIVENVGANGIVNAASIVASINAQGESAVKIQADRLELTGLITAQDLAGNGTTTIDGSNIKTGTIEGIELISNGSNEWERVTIRDGLAEFYSGLISSGSEGQLTMEASSQLYLRGPKVYIGPSINSNQNNWVFDDTGITLQGPDGTVIKRVAFQ